MFDRYKVKEGDTLDYIAKKFGSNRQYLKNINDLYFIENLKEGMDIVVPSKRETYYDVVKSEISGSIDDISKYYNVNPRLIESLNGFDAHDYIYLKQNILLPKTNYSFYITQEGDTADSVSKVFDISKDRLYNQNKTIYLLSEQIIVNKKINR